MNNMLDLMLDVETLGRGPGCIVPQVSILPFHLNGKPVEDTSKVLNCKLHMGTQLAAGYTIDADTTAWWLKQKAHVREDVFSGVMTLDEFRVEFATFLKWVNDTYANYRIWASAPKLDFGCLHTLLADPGKEYPILYSAERDVRTLRELVKTLIPEFKLPKLPVTHDALDDCRRQIIEVQSAYAALTNLASKAAEAEKLAAHVGDLMTTEIV